MPNFENMYVWMFEIILNLDFFHLSAETVKQPVGQLAVKSSLRDEAIWIKCLDQDTAAVTGRSELATYMYCSESPWSCRVLSHDNSSKRNKTWHYFSKLKFNNFHAQIQSSGARKNDVNAMCYFAGNSSFCQVHAFKSGHLLHPFANLSFVCFICQILYQGRFSFQIFISWNFIYNAKGIFKSWEFYCSHPFAGNKQSVPIVSFPAGRARSCSFSVHLTKWLCDTKLLSISKHIQTHGQEYSYLV